MPGKLQLDVPQGRWLVEVRENGTYAMSRIDDHEMAFGGSGPDLPVPGVHAWFDALPSYVLVGATDEDGDMP